VNPSRSWDFLFFEYCLLIPRTTQE